MGAERGRRSGDSPRGRRTDAAIFLEELEDPSAPGGVDCDGAVEAAEAADFTEFEIRESTRDGKPTVRMSPDLPVCEECLAELFDSRDRRYQYPYINCTNCGPRYTVMRSLPYDRPNTTMAAWPLDAFCAGEYDDPAEPALSCAAGGVPGVRAALLFSRCAQAEGETVRGDADSGESGGAAFAGWSDSGGERAGRLSPGLRRAKCGSGFGDARRESIAKKNRSR